MTFDFDKIIDRRGTGALKYDALGDFFGNPDLLPLWVADMDFETPPFIMEALRKRLEHPILGYTIKPADYFPSIIDWIESHHGWKIREEWLSYIPGVVKGIGMVINVFTNPGDKVIIQPPVYHPFRLVPLANGREVVFNPLIKRADGLYEMDFDNLEKVADDCKILILANPHNPGGIVWDRQTLEKLAGICHRKGLIVISDEIHCDLTMFGHRHIPFASVSPDAAEISITFGAPTKTFNIAGIVSSYVVIPNDSLRRRFFTWLAANEMGDPNMMAPVATIAAYRHGEEWRRSLISYIEENIRYVEKYCAENIPGVKAIRPEASYLVWLDCRGLGLGHEELLRLFTDKARLALNDGGMFGKEGEGFMRLNVACPKATLEKAMSALREAVAF